MALALKDRVKETTIVVGTGTATLLGSSIGFQPFSVVGNGNTTYYCISDQFGSNWEVGIGTYTTSGNTLSRTTVLASSNAGALVVFTAGVKDVFVTYPSEKGVWLDANGNAIGLGTPAAFVGTNITGTASGLTAGYVTTNANLTGAITSVGNATSLGSFTSANLAAALTDETGTGSAVFSDNASLLNPTYTGTLTGSTGVLNIGSGQVYKDASGNVGIGTTPTSVPATGNPVVGASNLIMYNAGNLGLTLLTDLAATRTQQIGFGSAGISLFDAGFKYDNSSRGLQLWTGSGPKMTIDSSGNVGIGTSSPSTKLEVKSVSNAEAKISTDNNAYAYLTLNTWALDRAQLRGEGANPGAGSGTGSGVLSFWTANNSALAERMRIDSSGNVGIGTSSPSTKLTVAGSITITGANALRGSYGGGAITSNFAAGDGALASNTTGANNTASGQNALYNNTTGNQNTASGQSALYNNTTGSGNSAFNPLNSAGSYVPVFNPTTENNRFCMGSTGVTNAYIQVAWTVVSDARDKTNFAPVPHGLDFVNQLQPTAYQFKEDRETDVATGIVRYGFKAQDILALEGDTPVIIDTEDLDKLRFNSDSLIPVLVNAIKELTARLELLEGK